VSEPQSKFRIWKWTLLGALYGAFPLPSLLLYGDLSSSIERDGTFTGIRDGALREHRNLFLILFFCALIPAYLVGRSYKKQCEQGMMKINRYRWRLVIYGGVIAATPIVTIIAPIFAYLIDKAKWDPPSIGTTVLMMVILGPPIALFGAFATGILLLQERWMRKGDRL
jgi:hypothetical protein